MTLRNRAQSITEVIVGLIVLVPVILILIDIGSLIIASAVNSDICRAAARAAANGAPDRIDAGRPKERALAVVNAKKNEARGNVSVNLPIQVWETVRDPLPAKPFGGAVDGEVTVETSITCRPPFLVGAVVPGGVEIKARQTYPFTWAMSPDDLVSGGFGGGSSGRVPPQTTTNGTVFPPAGGQGTGGGAEGSGRVTDTGGTLPTVSTGAIGGGMDVSTTGGSAQTDGGGLGIEQ